MRIFYMQMQKESYGSAGKKRSIYIVIHSWQFLPYGFAGFLNVTGYENGGWV